MLTRHEADSAELAFATLTHVTLAHPTYVTTQLAQGFRVSLATLFVRWTHGRYHFTKQNFSGSTGNPRLRFDRAEFRMIDSKFPGQCRTYRSCLKGRAPRVERGRASRVGYLFATIRKRTLLPLTVVSACAPW